MPTPIEDEMENSLIPEEKEEIEEVEVEEIEDEEVTKPEDE